MLDTKFILANLDRVKQAIEGKKAASSYTDLDEFVRLDEERRKAQAESDRLTAEKRKISKEIGSLLGQLKKVEDPQKVALEAQSAALQEQSRQLDAAIHEFGVSYAKADARLNEMRAHIPNVADESVPPGTSDSDNVTVREWGQARSFEFKPRYHYELGPELGILDCERGAKISGAGWYFLKNDGAKLERALINWFLDTHRQHGYSELFPPFFVSEQTLFGTGQLPKFREQMYYTNEDRLFAIPTAEVPVTSFHRDEILEEAELPKYYCAYSACFRREAGAAGKDTRGILRVHQFNKVEMLKLTTPETSLDELEKLVADAERLLQAMALRYRVIQICMGDLGFSGTKQYDLEVWAPATQRWLEVSSCSNFSDYQARRCNLRYRPADGGKPRFLHTVNGSGLALPRIQVALWETYQQQDGSIPIPEVLRPYMGGQTSIVAQRK